MKSFLIYLFWPNPANATYASPKAIAALALCGALVLLSLGLRLWHRRQEHGIVRKLSRSWATAAMSFGIAGLFLTVARAEQIQYVSMRFWWVVWLALALLYILIQARLFRARYYQVLPQVKAEDPREKYLPGRR